MQTDERDPKSDYAAAKAEVTEHLVEQLRIWRNKLSSQSVPAERVEETDRLFAAQMAARLLELSLRPAAVHDIVEIRQLVRPFRDGKFHTDLTLEDIITMIAETGVLLKGHFMLLADQLHSDYFFMFSRLGTRVEFRKRLASELAKRFSPIRVDSVIAPVTAGGLLVQDVANQLKAKFAFYDVDEHSRPLGIRRGYSVEGSTLIVNDIATTGRGLELMLKVSEEAQLKPVGIGLIATRGTAGCQMDAGFYRNLKVEALFNLDIDTVKNTDCAKCHMGLPSVSSTDINR